MVLVASLGPLLELSGESRQWLRKTAEVMSTNVSSLALPILDRVKGWQEAGET
jgi:hypothetical protein